jgi:hypothetical protein
MPDETKPKDLETVLARLQNEWRDLADLLTTQGKSQDRIIEVEQILFRDASGQYRGKISANPDGSADLLLCDTQGKAWARLGVNQDGEAFLELKDQHGESNFKAAVGAPAPGAFPGPAATSADGPNSASPQARLPAEAAAAPRAESGPVSVIPTPGYGHPGADANSGVFDRLEKLTHQHQRQKFYWALILVLMGVILGIQAYVLLRPEPRGLAVESLAVCDPNRNIRATLGTDRGQVRLDLWDPHGHRRATLGLGSEGTPRLAFYDRDQRVRADLKLGADGEPKFTLRDQRSLQGKTEPNDFSDSSQQSPRGGVVSGAAGGAVAAQAEAVSPDRDAGVEFVGFKNSNKYHYPTCKWARTRYPAQLVKFKSTAEAQERHYVPCPICKPPPLSR